MTTFPDLVLAWSFVSPATPPHGKGIAIGWLRVIRDDRSLAPLETVSVRAARNPLIGTDGSDRDLTGQIEEGHGQRWVSPN